MRIYYYATAFLLFGFSLLACALNVGDMADIPWAFVLVLDLAALSLLVPCACRALRRCWCCLVLLLFFPGCQALRDAKHAAAINANLAGTDAWFALYSNKSNK